MKTYAKFKEGVLEWAPATMQTDGYTVSNPSAERLAALGYKPVVYDKEPPQPDDPAVAYSPRYVEQQDRILVRREQYAPASDAGEREFSGAPDDPLDEVSAHSDCTLAARVEALENRLDALLAGREAIPELQVDKLTVLYQTSLVLTGEGAPKRAPGRAGLFYIDMSARTLYFSTGNEGVVQWKLA
ncbi:hypothetical protein [Alistipes sp.]|uniref:hypothetical protein n=1 Tax=Alistipes sp. TaxID=1872444 RepID=UPI003AF122E4